MTTSNILTAAQILQINEFANANGLNFNVDANYSDWATFYFQPRMRSTEESIHDGMQCLFDGEAFEVAQYAAGPKQNEFRVYGNYPTLKGALSSLLKGNSSRRKPIAVSI